MSESLINIQVGWAPVIEQLNKAVAGLGNRRGLMSQVAGIMMRAVEDNFAAEGRPRWVDLADSTKASRAAQGTWPGKILQRSGRLAASIQERWDNDSAAVGTNVVYAAIQQFGGRTKPHVIEAKHARALSFGGICVRKVNHPGSVIPARRFLSITPSDQREIYLAAQEFLADRVMRGAFKQISEFLPH